MIEAKNSIAKIENVYSKVNNMRIEIKRNIGIPNIKIKLPAFLDKYFLLITGVLK
ncbi:hypothetical protein [Polaribacter uvawellassae]|uniref:hypothetical protein n=1 Tax=Polaribacter uvawellassae TaxID=3133495 RepID=UPI00321977DC